MSCGGCAARMDDSLCDLCREAARRHRELTWDELKAAVDAKLAELGKDGSVSIQYIDISWPYASEERSIWLDLGMLAVL